MYSICRVSAARHVYEGRSAVYKRRSLVDGKRYKPKLGVEQQPCRVFVKTGNLHLVGSVTIECQAGHRLYDKRGHTLAPNARRDDDIADTANAIAFSSIKIGKPDDSPVELHDGRVEALRDRGIQLPFRKREVRFWKHEKQLLSVLRKTADQFYVASLHWPVVQFHCSSLSSMSQHLSGQLRVMESNGRSANG